MSSIFRIMYVAHIIFSVKFICLSVPSAHPPSLIEIGHRKGAQYNSRKLIHLVSRVFQKSNIDIHVRPSNKKLGRNSGKYNFLIIDVGKADFFEAHQLFFESLIDKSATIVRVPLFLEYHATKSSTTATFLYTKRAMNKRPSYDWIGKLLAGSHSLKDDTQAPQALIKDLRRSAEQRNNCLFGIPVSSNKHKKPGFAKVLKLFDTVIDDWNTLTGNSTDIKVRMPRKFVRQKFQTDKPYTVLKTRHASSDPLQVFFSDGHESSDFKSRVEGFLRNVKIVTGTRNKVESFFRRMIRRPKTDQLTVEFYSTELESKPAFIATQSKDEFKSYVKLDTDIASYGWALFENLIVESTTGAIIEADNTNYGDMNVKTIHLWDYKPERVKSDELSDDSLWWIGGIILLVAAMAVALAMYHKLTGRSIVSLGYTGLFVYF